jgi:SAM-dependent methyltransferase
MLRRPGRRPATHRREAIRLGLTSAQLAAWPGRERRDPPSSDRHYLSLSSLSAVLRASLERQLATRHDLTVLDIGCGRKPYLPLLAPYASRYVGFDFAPGPEVDDVGVAEALPYADGSFDVVLCTQMLEHAEDPALVVREIHRVLAPGGVVFASTHGVFLYHPDPPGSGRDYWRWTHAGLRRLFESSGQWKAIDIEPNGDVVACLGYIAAQFVDEGLERLRLKRVRRLLLAAFNRAVVWVDRRYPPRARVPAAGSLSSNYLVTARRS